ncbi:peroxiredoxin-like family protein [Metabacillus indicus]|uniref:peroxiredoxin-like family protein n=1 Tax=Metabacillus indicus TaxID=246786 RepID=UPI003CFA4B99
MTALLEQIKEYKEQFKKKAPAEKQELMNRATEELRASGTAQGLKVGEKAPDFTLPDATGKKVTLSEELKNGPVILTFYRGGWCPYCNLELKAYQRELDAINEASANLIAVSPETPDASLSTKEKNELDFLVLSDEGGNAGKAYDLVFDMPDYLIEVYKDSGLDVATHNGNDDWRLPKPATFVIGQDGVILFAEVDSDYTKRTDPEKVISVVQNLNK